jgi:hypothetical protein
MQGGEGGMRWGYDDSWEGLVGDAWVRAPACGAEEWSLLTNFGLEGAWVFRVCVDACCPVEVEDLSWGEVKARYYPGESGLP